MSENYIIFFDGLTEPTNPGGTMAFGWTLEMPGEIVVGKGAVEAAPRNTNNVAEYLALYKALQRTVDVKTHVFTGLMIHGDSKLVCEQIAGRWRINNQRLQAAHARCMELLNKLQPWKIQWVPREQNEAADLLSREAYQAATGKIAPERAKRRAG